MRIEAIKKGGYYPTPEVIVNHITNHFFNRRYVRYNSIITRKADYELYPNLIPAQEPNVIRILDPCAGTGAALQELGKAVAASVKNYDYNNRIIVKTYGIEPNVDRATEAERNVDHVLQADLFNTVIANGLFHILFLNPPYDHDSETGRLTLKFLLRSTNYLEDNGLLIFIIPKNDLKACATLLSSQYHDIGITRFQQPEYDIFDQIIVTGRRNPNPPFKQDTKEYLDNLSVLNDQEFLNKVSALNHVGRDLTPKSYYCASPNIPIMFATKTIDYAQAVHEVDRSGHWGNNWWEETLMFDPHLDKQPLMPLRQGHVALLIAAGFLNNLLLTDNDGNQVIIKGILQKDQMIVEDTETTTVYQEFLQASLNALNLETGEFETIS